MSKIVLYGKESRDKLVKGAQAAAKAIGSTMGAAGRNVIIGESVYHEGWLMPLANKVTKDGYTVAKHFELADPIENRGAMGIREACTKTVEVAGDATTCTAVIADYLITEGVKLIDGNANCHQIAKGMDEALNEVVEGLKKISTPVRGNNERIKQIATVSANNDTEIGDLIAEAFSKIGDDGVLDIEANQSTKTEIKIIDGYKFDRGWVSPYFITNRSKETCEFDNPIILFYQNKINHHTQIEKAIHYSIQMQRPLLIISEDSVDEGLAYMAINNKKAFNVCAVKSPFGETRHEEMEDLALLTGGTYIGDIRGIDIKEDLIPEHFGQAKKVIISRNETTIIGGNKDAQKFEDFVNDLKMNLALAKTEQEKYPIEKRIARLNSSVAVIQVGAATETELNEKIDRVDDAVRATKAAIAEGFVAGGGSAFLIIKQLYTGDSSSDFEIGKKLVYDSLSAPFNQICKNAGIDDNSKVILTGINAGYNVLTGNVEDMVKAGIIDSTKALRFALTNAVSVAKMFLTSECSIITTS